MKNLLFAVLCTLLTCAPAFSQKAPIKFGDISMEDMKMTVYPKDSSAEAVVLCDYGTSEIQYDQNDGFIINFERIKRLKILTKDGLKHAEFWIPLWRDGDTEERLNSLKVVTYNLENGKIVETKTKSESFFREQTVDNLTVMKIAPTNVKEGSIIEISYRIRSEFLFNFQGWEFQSTIPERWSEYRAVVPQYFNYQRYMQGYVGLAVNENSMKSGSISFTYGSGQNSRQELVNYTMETFRWAAQDVPAFRKEPFMTTINDYISKIKFELAYTNMPNAGIKQYMGTWADINNAYWDRTGGTIKGGDGALKDEVAAATAGATTDEQKVAGIFEYVRSNVSWNEKYTKFPGEIPKRVLESKTGSSAEINLLLAAMIEKTGVPVFPVLLSTRNHGFVREGAPMSSQFNYVICAAQLGGKMILLDATSKMLPFGVIPEHCLNGRGFLVSPDGYQWISLNPTVRSRTSITADIALTDAGEINGTLNVDKIGYHSATARNQYLAKGESEYIKDFVSPLQWNVSKSEFANVKDVHLPFKEVHQFKAEEKATVSGNTIYFNPFIVGREEENPFKSPDRTYPVDFGNTFEEFYVAKIAIPEGYVVDELPQNKVFALAGNGGRYTYNFVQNGNVVNFTSALLINRPLFTQMDYPHLREFYSLVVAKQAEQIVFKRK